MKLFQLLGIQDAEIVDSDCKIHLASSNGFEDPLDVYFAGDFDEWQRWQTQKNFKRSLVVSLIKLPARHRWLYVGVHRVGKCQLHHNAGRNKDRDLFRYSMERVPTANTYCGRLVVSFARSGRQSYLNGDRWADKLDVTEILPEKRQFSDFPGFTSMLLTKAQLDTIIKQQNPSWRGALSSVSGVYVISDRESGMLYVGSAVGDQGIWGRWCAYSNTGHGGNKELRQLLSLHDVDYSQNFQFGILETADTKATSEEILARENHWKLLLLSRAHGHNAN